MCSANAGTSLMLNENVLLVKALFWKTTFTLSDQISSAVNQSEVLRE